MTQRWQVVRGSVKHKGTLYFTGDFLPEEFTDRDRARHIYSRRMELVDYVDPATIPEVIDKPTTPPLKKAEEVTPKDSTPEVPPAPPTNTTGTRKATTKLK